MSPKKPTTGDDPESLDPDRLRWRCEPSLFSFQNTGELESCPIRIIGQPRALEALQLGQTERC